MHAYVPVLVLSWFLKHNFFSRYLLILFRDAPVEVWAMTKNPMMVLLPFLIFIQLSTCSSQKKQSLPHWLLRGATSFVLKAILQDGNGNQNLLWPKVYVQLLLEKKAAVIVALLKMVLQCYIICKPLNQFLQLAKDPEAWYSLLFCTCCSLGPWRFLLQC